MVGLLLETELSAIWSKSFNLRQRGYGGEITQFLRAYSAPAENLSSLLSTHTEWLSPTSNSNSRGLQTLLIYTLTHTI